MTLEQLGSPGELIGAIGVIISLAFLAFLAFGGQFT